MVPGGSDRGVSPVLGTLLVAAILVLLVTALQVTAVPAWNSEVEFDHGRTVVGDMRGLRDAVVGTAADGNGRSATIALGVEYPRRLVLRNPPDPSGTLRTTDPATLSIDGATAPGEAGEYWDGTPKSFVTRALEYEPSYNYYDDAPVTVYGSGVLYNRFDGAAVTLTPERLIDGNRITLVLLNGTLAETRAGTVTVGTRPISAPATPITVENPDEPITLTVPTGLSASTWRELLADEEHVLAVDPVAGADAVTIALEPGVSYELRIAAVGVGRRLATAGPRYLVRGTDRFVEAADGRSKLVVEARDRFNNPRSNARVTFAASPDAGRFEDAGGAVLGAGRVTVRTDADGRAVVWFNASAPGLHDVEAFLGGRADPTLPAERRTRFAVRSAGAAEGAAFVSLAGASAEPGTDVITFTLHNGGTAAINLTGVQLAQATEVNQGGGGGSGTFSDGPTEIVSLSLDGETRAVSARERRRPDFFAGAPLAVRPGENTLALTFDRAHSDGANDQVMVRFRLFFEGDITATYDLVIFP